MQHVGVARNKGISARGGHEQQRKARQPGQVRHKPPPLPLAGKKKTLTHTPKSNSPGISRLGLSAYQWWNEALHGVAHNRGITWAQSGSFSAATQFPQAITTSAAFDDTLIHQIGASIGTEARAFANAGRAHLDFWTPNINPFRDPRWGRGHETPGEDPLRNARWADAFVRGMQGDDPTTHRVI